MGYFRQLLTFTLLACYLLLAHAAISHHHHQNSFCTEKVHCINEKESDHQHDNGNAPDGCVLKTLIFLPDHSKITLKDYPISYTDHYFLAQAELSWCLQISKNEFTTCPDISGQYSQPVTLTYGLRAPPLM